MSRRKKWTRSLSRVAFVLPLALLLGACNPWLMYGFDATHSGGGISGETYINASNVGSLSEAGYSDDANSSESVIRSAPTSYYGLVYDTENVGPNGDGWLNAYSADGSKGCSLTGNGGTTLPYSCTQTVWSAEPAGGHGLNSSPAIDTVDGVVLVGSDDGVVHAYAAATGTLLWQSRTLGGEINGSLTIAYIGNNGYLYVPEVYGWTYVFPLTNGTDNKNPSCQNQSAGRICYPEYRVHTPGSVDSSPAVAQLANGNWYLYTTSNLPTDWLWAFPGTYSASACPNTTGQYPSAPYGDINGDYTIGDVVQCNPDWYANWDPVGGTSPVVNVAKDLVYVGTQESGLQAFSADGTQNCYEVLQPSGQFDAGQYLLQCNNLWTSSGAGATARQDGSSAALDAGAGPNGTVYIGDRHGTLWAFDAANGNARWSANLGGSIDSAPAIADGVLYVGCSNQFEANGQTCSANLFAFNPDTGAQLWTGNTGGTSATIDNSPIVIDNGTPPNTPPTEGALYVGSSSGILGGTGYGCFSPGSPTQCSGQLFAFSPTSS